MGNENCCGPNEENGERNNISVKEIMTARQIERQNEVHPAVRANGSNFLEKNFNDQKVSETTRTDPETQRDQKLVSPPVPPLALEKKSSLTIPEFHSMQKEELVERPEIQLPDGSKYKGQWKGEKKHGTGRLNYVDGAVYEGSACLT